MKNITIKILICLFIVLMGVVGYNMFFNVKSPDNTTIAQNQINGDLKGENYEIGNYVTITEMALKNGEILNRKIEFKNISEELIERTKKYNREYNYFNLDGVDSNKQYKSLAKNNEVYAKIVGDDLAYFEKEDVFLLDLGINEYYMNDFVYNLKTSTELSNEEVLKKYKINIDKFFNDIIGNMVNTITDDELLVGTDGNIMAEKVPLKSLEDNKDKYIDMLKNEINNDDLFHLKLEKTDDGVSVSIYYLQSKALEKMNLCSHMDNGLVAEPIVLKYSGKLR